MFSIIIPLYNKATYIIRCLESVFNQSYKDFEVIVINDGSTDNGATLVKENFPQVTIITQQNKGVCIARNNGILASKHAYIAFLDADDAWHSEYLSSVLNIINDNQGAKIIGARYSFGKEYLTNPLDVLNYFEIKDYLKIAVRNTLFSSSSTVINRQLIVNNKIEFNPQYKRGEDTDYWLRINLLPGKAFYINNVLVFYSHEDENQAIRNLANIEDTFMANICVDYKNYYKHNSDLNRFVSLYVYFNLYRYFFHPEFHTKAQKVLLQIPRKKTWLQLPYRIPFMLGCQLIKNPKGAKIIRLYLKFFIRYVY